MIGLSPRRACNRLYYHFIKEATAEEREKFDNELYAPAKGTSSFLAQLNDLSDDE